MEGLKLRKIQVKDNQQLKEAIQTVLLEMGAPKVGTAYEDESLDNMFQAYHAARMGYFVIEENGKIMGGAGIAPLANTESNICELQKMYLLSIARKKGLGAKLMEKCIDFAKENQFEKVYLETMPYMENARKLYLRSGFKELENPLGDTGHYNCTRWMLLDINNEK